MKAVMISIKPKWCELIASGKKIIEVRKTRPVLKTPFKCYIYCTKGSPYLNQHNGIYYLESKDMLGGRGYGTYKRLSGLVIGEFICDSVIVDKPYGHDPLFRAAACMNQVEAASYCLNAEMYGWHISDLVIYNKPRQLKDYRMPCREYEKENPQCGYCDYYRTMGEYPAECGVVGRKPMTRPPQSWCYVEEEQGK